MIKAEEIRIMEIKGVCNTSHVIEIHFGIKPRKGGRPPKDKRFVRIKYEFILLKVKWE